MTKLNQNHKNGKGYKGRKPTLSDLHDFPDSGIHRHIFNLALFLKNWRGEKITTFEAVELIKQKFYHSPQRREIEQNEVENAVSKAFDSSKIKTSSSQKVFIAKQVMTSVDSIWPKNLQKLVTEEACKESVSEALQNYYWPVAKMVEDSRIATKDLSPAEILGLLYKKSDLICSGTLYKPKTRLLRDWLEIGLNGDLFCPNPMRVEHGINMDGEVSERCRDNAGRRKYLVYESDDKTLDFNAKACLIKCLWDKTGANLRMVVNSGGKSLHACFDASEDEEINWQFMSLAVKYGGDPGMYRPEQQSRLPNAFRRSKKTGKYLFDANGNKIRQTCLYLDPR